MVEGIENMEIENQREETFVFKNIDPEDPYAYLNKIYVQGESYVKVTLGQITGTLRSRNDWIKFY